MQAIEHGHRICDWHENLSKDEVPPHWMWPFEDELESWFEEVEQQRKERFSGGGSGTEADDVPMTQNELAKGRR